MANVIHRTTLQYRRSVNTPDFQPKDWIANPDLSAVERLPRKYWAIDGDRVVEMSEGQKAYADRAELAAMKAARLETLRDEVIEKLAIGDADFQEAAAAVEAAENEVEVEAVELK